MLDALFRERAIGSVPWSVQDDIGWGNWIGDRRRTSTGVDVDEHAATSLLAVYGSATFITDEIATLPVNIDGGARPAWVDEPSEGLDRIAWVGQLVWSLLLSGNAYVAVIGNPTRPAAMEPLDPTKVRVERENGKRVVYVSGERASVPIVHIPGRMRPGDLIGMAPVEWARQSIGLGLAAQEYGAQFFDGEGNMPGIIEAPHPMQPESMRNLASQWQAKRSQGGRGLPGVLQNGATWKATGVTNEQAQFLATRKYTSAEIAGQMFLLDPSDLGIPVEGSNLTYANLEQRNTRRMQVALMPWIRRIESQLSEVLPRGATYRFDVDSRLRGNTRESYETLQVAVDAGFMSTNEVREILGLPPEADEGGGLADLAEMVRKLYLGVGVLMTADEARAILADAGAQLGPGFVQTKLPTEGGRAIDVMPAVRTAPSTGTPWWSPTYTYTSSGSTTAGGDSPFVLRHGGSSHDQKSHGNWANGLTAVLDRPDLRWSFGDASGFEDAMFQFQWAVEHRNVFRGNQRAIAKHFGAIAVSQAMTADERAALEAELNQIVGWRASEPAPEWGDYAAIGTHVIDHPDLRSIYDAAVFRNAGSVVKTPYVEASLLGAPVPFGIQMQVSQVNNMAVLLNDEDPLTMELRSVGDWYVAHRAEQVALGNDWQAVDAQFSAELTRLTGVDQAAGFAGLLNRSWTSSSQSIPSQALQLEVADQVGIPFTTVVREFRLDNPDATPFNNEPRFIFKQVPTPIEAPASMHWVSTDSLDRSTAFRSTLGDSYAAVVSSQRRHTATIVAEWGEQSSYTFPESYSVTLYRGVSGTATVDAFDGEFLTNPLSSWTLERSVAQDFAGSLDGYVVTAEVPVDRIFAAASYSGLGALTESEVIVMADEDSLLTPSAIEERSQMPERRIVNLDEHDADWIKQVAMLRGTEERSTPGLTSTRHGGGSHDDKDHGNWATGGVAEKLAEALKANEGFTYDTAAVDFVTTGLAVAHDRASYTERLSALSIRQADAWFADPDAAAEHVEQFMEQLGRDGYDADTKLGGWYDQNHGEIVLDAVKVFPADQREAAIEQGRLWNQQAIADLDAITRGDWEHAFIDTGGTGGRSATGPTSRRSPTEGQGLGRPHRGRPQGDGASVRDQAARAGGQAAADVQGLRHRPGGHDHDQSTHGNWANKLKDAKQGLQPETATTVAEATGGQFHNLTVADLGIHGQFAQTVYAADGVEILARPYQGSDTRVLFTVRRTDGQPFDRGPYNVQYVADFTTDSNGYITHVTWTPDSETDAEAGFAMINYFDSVGLPANYQGALDVLPESAGIDWEDEVGGELFAAYNGPLTGHRGDGLYLDDLTIESEVSPWRGGSFHDEGDIEGYQVSGVIYDAAGARVGDFQRTVDLRTGVVSNDSFSIRPDARGYGIGTAFLDRTERVLADQGLDAVQLQAVDVGKYAWASRGYEADIGYYRTEQAIDYWRTVAEERITEGAYDRYTAAKMEALWEDYDNLLVLHPYDLVLIDSDFKDVLLEGPSWNGRKSL